MIFVSIYHFPAIGIKSRFVILSPIGDMIFVPVLTGIEMGKRESFVQTTPITEEENGHDDE